MDNKLQKQKFLFTEIIEQNYDPEQFQEFMVSYKEADDLDDWSLEELKDVVEKFKKQVKQEKENSSSVKRSIIFQDQSQIPAQQPKLQSKQAINSAKQISPIKKQQKKHPLASFTSSSSKLQPTQPQSKQPHPSKQPPIPRTTLQQDLAQPSSHSRLSTITIKQQGKYLQYDYKSRHEIFSQTIDCVITTPNALLTKDIEIKIQKYNKKEGGLFSQAYVDYTVFTKELGVKVERRYSDFEWLKKNLELLHPGLPVPPIAKKGQFRRYDDKHLWKRVMILEMFLNKLMEIPQLKAQQLIQSWLKITDRGQFQKFKAGFKGLTVPNNIKNLKNMKGKIHLSIEPRINSFLARSQKNLTQVQPQTKKIYKQFKAAATMLQGCGQTLKNVARICDELNQKDQAFRQKVELKYVPNNVYTAISQATTRLAQQLQKQAKTFRQLFHPLIKYQSLHMLNMLDNFDTLAQLQKNFQATKSALIRKKLRLYEQGNMSKWGLTQTLSQKPQKTKALEMMLPKENKELQKLRQKYAFYNFQMYEELNRFYSSKNYHLGKYLQEYCRTQTKISSQLMMIWVDMETNVITMRENKYMKKV